MCRDKRSAAAILKPKPLSFVPSLPILVRGSILLFSASAVSFGAEKRTFPANAGDLLGGASKNAIARRQVINIGEDVAAIHFGNIPVELCNKGPIGKRVPRIR
jgi:hypothetical protein